MKYIIHTDGGSRGNPGPAAVGVSIEKIVDGQTHVVEEFGKVIGQATNNVAEYMAVVEALTWMRDNPDERGDTGEKIYINFYLDSTLVVNQLNGLFKIKDANLRTLVTKVRILEQEVGEMISYDAVRREQNTRADFLVNKALDEDKGK